MSGARTRGCAPLRAGRLSPSWRRAAARCRPAVPAGVGYLLKDRVADVSDFIDAMTRVAEGGTVLDPEVVAHLLNGARRRDALAELSPKVVEKHVASIFGKLGLAPSDSDNRRVLAAIRYLGS